MEAYAIVGLEIRHFPGGKHGSSLAITDNLMQQ